MSKVKTITANLGSDYGNEGTATLTYTGADSITVSDSTFNLSSMFPSITCKLSVTTESGIFKLKSGSAHSNLTLSNNSNVYSYREVDDNDRSNWTNNQTKTLVPYNNSYPTLNTSSYFNANNPTARSVAISYSLTSTLGGGNMSGYGIFFEVPDQTLSLGQTIILNAPPTYSYTQLSKDTTDYYAGVTTVSTTISNLSAKYGGSISEAKLTIGSQSVTRTTNGILSLRLSTAGTFTPTVSVTDSRGQVTAYDLSAITVVDGTPTTFDYTQVSSSTDGFYAGLSVASVTVSNCSVPYDGSISEIRLTIGSQTAIRSTEGTLNISLNAIGNFSPVLKITDSFDRVYTVNFNAINVNAYSEPSIVFDVERVLTSSQPDYSYMGEPDDDGLGAVITATITWVNDVANLIAPTVLVEEADGDTVIVTETWYKTRATNGKLSDPISNWALLTPNDMPVYGFIDNLTHDALDTNYSYKVSITPIDNYQVGGTISQTIAQAFHTIDFLAGGHGISFGKPAVNEGVIFGIDMAPVTELDVDSGASSSSDASSGSDKDLFNVIRRNGWFNDVIEMISEAYGSIIKKLLSKMLSQAYSISQSIASIENSPATSNHAVGEFIVYNDRLYLVTSAITAGQTLVVGTNISATNCGDQIRSKINTSAIANNLTTTDSGYVLDARQGKALNDGKINTSAIANNLTTTASGYVLDARQGKTLNEKIFYSDYNVSVGGSQYCGYYYGDVGISTSYTFLGVAVRNPPSNVFAYSVLINSSRTVRVFSTSANITVGIRVLYMR